MSEGIEFRKNAGELLWSRGLILFSILVDAALLALATLVLIGVHLAIDYALNGKELSVIDTILVVGIQALTAAGTLGVLVAFLIRDLVHAFRRIWSQ